MLCVTTLWIAFLCFKFIECEKTVNLLQSFNKEVSVKTCSFDPLLYEVQLGQEDQIKGYIFTNHHPLFFDKPAEISKAHAAFYLTNCDFASWIMYKIFNLIKSSPLLYKYKFVFDGMYDTEYKPPLENNLNAFQANTDELDKFQEVLFTFILSKPNISKYYDIGIINSVTSTMIKIFSLFFPKNDNKTSSEIHFNIIRLVLIEIIDFQRFLLLRCPEKSTSNQYTQLNGLWISFFEEKVTNDRIEKIISMANIQFRFQSQYMPNTFCNPSEMLNIINIDLKDTAFIGISTAKVKITQNKYATIEDILKQMKINYDKMVVYFCHEIVLIAIMKQIILNAKDVFIIQKSLQNDINNRIHQIYTKLKKEYSPLFIRKGFEILRDIIKSDNQFSDKVNELEDLSNELFSYIVSTKLNTTITNNSDLNTNDDYYNDKNNNISKLLNIIEKNISNFKCFKTYFKTIDVEYELYYGPFAKNLDFLLQKNNKRKVEEECDFVTSVFSITHQLLTFVNGYFDSTLYADKIMFFDGAINAYSNIKNYFLLIVKNGTDNVDILKMARNISTVLLNFSINFQRTFFHREVKRILNFIMNEMESYALKYCTSSENDFLILNNINFYELGDADTIDNSIKIFMKNNVNNMNNILSEDFKFETSINEKDYEYLNVHYFFDNYITNTRAYKTYSDKILFTWYGSVQTIKNILEYETAIFILPPNAHEVYEVYFKFCAAVIFFRIKEILMSTDNLANIEFSFNNMNKIIGNEDGLSKYFPSNFLGIFWSINDDFLYFPEESKKNKDISESSVVEKLRNNITTIERMYQVMRIRFADMNEDTVCYNIKRFYSTVSRRPIGCYIPMPDSDFEVLLRELLHNIKFVFDNFSKLMGKPYNEL